MKTTPVAASAGPGSVYKSGLIYRQRSDSIGPLPKLTWRFMGALTPTVLCIMYLPTSCEGFLCNK